MRLFRDDLATEVPVRWYYVPSTRPVIPFGHPFGNRDWEFRDGDPGLLLGEVYGSRRYYGGQDPVDLAGQGFCGSREQWERGASVLDPVRPVNPTTGRQCCCGGGVLQGTPGVVFGLDHALEFPPTVSACAAFNPSSQFWDFIISGVEPLEPLCLDIGDVLNRQWKVSHLAGCIWRCPDFTVCLPSFVVAWFLMWNHPFDPGVWTLRLSGGITGTVWAKYRALAATWRPTDSNAMTLVSVIDPGLTMPATVTVIPWFA